MHELERLGDAHGLDRDVGAESVGELATRPPRVLDAELLHRDVGAEPLGGLEPGVGQVDRHDVARAEQLGAHDRRQPDRTGTDHRDDVAGPTRPLSTPTS